MKLVTLLLFLLTSNVMATPTADNRLLIGKSLLEFPIFGFDLYEIHYYVNKGDRSEELVLSYKRDIDRKHSIMGWDKGLEHIIEKKPELSIKAEWIKTHTVDVKEGDQIKLSKIKDKVSIYKNNKLISSIEDSDISKLIFEP